MVIPEKRTKNILFLDWLRMSLTLDRATLNCAQFLLTSELVPKKE